MSGPGSGVGGWSGTGAGASRLVRRRLHVGARRGRLVGYGLHLGAGRGRRGRAVVGLGGQRDLGQHERHQRGDGPRQARAPPCRGRCHAPHDTRRPPAGPDGAARAPAKRQARWRRDLGDELDRAQRPTDQPDDHPDQRVARGGAIGVVGGDRHRRGVGQPRQVAQRDQEIARAHRQRPDAGAPAPRGAAGAHRTAAARVEDHAGVAEGVGAAAPGAGVEHGRVAEDVEDAELEPAQDHRRRPDLGERVAQPDQEVEQDRLGLLGRRQLADDLDPVAGVGERGDVAGEAGPLADLIGGLEGPQLGAGRRWSW